MDCFIGYKKREEICHRCHAQSCYERQLGDVNVLYCNECGCTWGEGGRAIGVIEPKQARRRVVKPVESWLAQPDRIISTHF